MTVRPASLIALVCTALTLALAGSAFADGILTPSIGVDFGGNAGTCPSTVNCSSRHLTYGGAIGYMGGGIFGIEEDVNYAPNFFGDVPSLGHNGVLTAMTNLIVGVPLGPVRPYASGGLGLMRVDVDLGSLASFSNSSLGYDLGGGVMGFLAPHVGIRVDYRYLRNTSNVTVAGFSITNTQLSFSRATAGVVFRF